MFSKNAAAAAAADDDDDDDDDDFSKTAITDISISGSSGSKP